MQVVLPFLNEQEPQHEGQEISEINTRLCQEHRINWQASSRWCQGKVLSCQGLTQSLNGCSLNVCTTMSENVNVILSGNETLTVAFLHSLLCDLSPYYPYFPYYPSLNCLPLPNHSGRTWRDHHPPETEPYYFHATLPRVTQSTSRNGSTGEDGHISGWELTVEIYNVILSITSN